MFLAMGRIHKHGLTLNLVYVILKLSLIILVRSALCSLGIPSLVRFCEYLDLV